MAKSHPRQQTLPYLHRNWKACVNSLEADAKIANGDDDHDVRPAKRRRYVDSPDSGLGPEIDGFVLHEDPVDSQRAMRIEVLKITHKDDTLPAKQNLVVNGNVPTIHGDVVTRARCKITVTTPGRTPDDMQILHCDSQMCNIRTSFNFVGVCRMARVYLPEPFLVPEHKIFVERDDDTVFDFADTYAVRVELESAGDPNWPPLNLTNMVFEDDMIHIRPSPRHWSLTAEVSNVLNRGRRSGVLKLRRGFRSVAKTDFVMDIDVRWATSLPAKNPTKDQALAYLAAVSQNELPDAPSVLTNGNVNGDHVNGNVSDGHLVNGHLTNGHLQLVEDDVEEDAEGELTPSRSLRVRGSKNYNLKDLSAKAQGRQPRKRAKITETQKADSDRIMYRLPKEAVPVKEVVTSGFSCCVCHATHQSLAQLRAHLFSHAQYRFEVSLTPGKPGYQLDVFYVADSSGVSLRPKVYSLGKPTKLFDLERYIEGDDSWVTSRLGPNNEESTSVVVSRKIPHPRAPRASQRTAIRPKHQKKVLVPYTQQPLFDPLSKAKLVPGTEIRRTFPDDAWLIQKHRDIVQDFCDVDASEKEYIKEWDAFIQKKHIVSEAFIGRAVVEFVTEKARWLLESPSRTMEFGKHLTVLIARGVGEETIKLVQAKLSEARIQKLSAQAPAVELPKEPPKRDPKGCAVCGKIVRGPSLLLCANEVRIFLFH
ncbi:hypothetical protein N0V82_009124 [Gnomoniopsis sp. IMI 355080]|nr:hypothetical protein N0V82_009124 [Gnomoniopsis sp. IMI 355080]